MVIHFGKHEDSESCEVVVGVAGRVGISGKLCCNPGHTVIDEDRLEDGHVVRENVLIHAKSSVNEEVEEYVTIRGLVCVHFLDKCWVVGAEVPWVILDMWWMRLFRDGEQEGAGNLVDQVHVSGVSISDIGAAVAQRNGGYPTEDSEVDEGFRWRRSRQCRTTDVDDEVVCGEDLLMDAVVDHSVVLEDKDRAFAAGLLEVTAGDYSIFKTEEVPSLQEGVDFFMYRRCIRWRGDVPMTGCVPGSGILWGDRSLWGLRGRGCLSMFGTYVRTTLCWRRSVNEWRNRWRPKWRLFW